VLETRLLLSVVCPIALLLAGASATQERSEAFAPKGTISVGSSADFRTVFLIAPATGVVTHVRAPDAMISLRADLSRDGKRVAISGSRGIWIFLRSGAGARRLVAASPTAFAPDWVTWAPSGRELVFTRNEALFTVSSTGRSVKELLGGRVDAPDWSPAGAPIVFVRNPSLKSGGGLIQSIEPDGRGIRSIVRGGHPDVSPDGSKLAFARGDGVYVMQIGRGKPKRIVRDGEHPEWSPDGRYLAFVRNVSCREGGCSGRVFIVRATGGKARAIGPEIFDIGPLSWSK